MITITYLWVSETQPSHREHNFRRSDDDVLRNLHESANCSTRSVLVHRHVELQSHKISTQLAANLKQEKKKGKKRAQSKFLITCTDWWVHISTSPRDVTSALAHEESLKTSMGGP